MALLAALSAMIELAYYHCLLAEKRRKGRPDAGRGDERNGEAGDARTGWCEATCPDLPQGSEPTRITAGPRPNPAVRGPGDQARQARGRRVGAGWRRAHGQLSKFRALLKVPGLVSSPSSNPRKELRAESRLEFFLPKSPAYGT